MKKQVISTLAGFVTVSGLFLSGSTTSAVTEEEIRAQGQKVDDLKAREAAAKARVDHLASEVQEVSEKLADCKEEKENLLKNSEKLLKKVSEVSEVILQRKEVIDKQARSLQSQSCPGVVGDLIRAVTNGVEEAVAVHRMFASQTELLDQQNQDREKVKNLLDENFEKLQKVETCKKEIEASKEELEQKQADLRTAQVSLEIERTSEEGKKNALMEQRKKSEEEAKAVRENQQKKAEAQQTATPKQQATAGGGAPASNSGSAPARSYQAGSLEGNTYTPGQCTHFVKSKCPWVPNAMGNAGEWAASFSENGYPVLPTPSVGAVACYQANTNGALGYGHVAVVTAVHADGSYDIIQGNSPRPSESGLRPNGGVSFISPK